MNDDTNPGPDDDAIISAENEGMDEAIGHTRQLSADLVAEAVAALEKERDELKDNMLRALAETDNVRKRANRQIEDARVYAVEKFARDLLAVSDNLQRAIDSVPADQRAALPDAVRTALEGVELTQKELVTVLARHGVTAIDAAPGAAFDPALHQAVTQIPSAQPAGSVAQLFQAGWRIGDRTLRAAMVAVSAGPGTLN
ncbi:MAG TPA: nucleotide exchange factor GrpE [Hyphomonadaceae bacterium]|jgi:molecular chaperone GrpE